MKNPSTFPSYPPSSFKDDCNDNEEEEYDDNAGAEESRSYKVESENGSEEKGNINTIVVQLPLTQPKVKLSI